MIFCQYLLRNVIYYPLLGQFLVPVPGSRDCVPPCSEAFRDQQVTCWGRDEPGDKGMGMWGGARLFEEDRFFFYSFKITNKITIK